MKQVTKIKQAKTNRNRTKLGIYVRILLWRIVGCK